MAACLAGPPTHPTVQVFIQHPLRVCLSYYAPPTSDYTHAVNSRAYLACKPPPPQVERVYLKKVSGRSTSMVYRVLCDQTVTNK